MVAVGSCLLQQISGCRSEHRREGEEELPSEQLAEELINSMAAG